MDAMKTISNLFGKTARVFSGVVEHADLLDVIAEGTRLRLRRASTL
jgi:hypothetical protein